MCWSCASSSGHVNRCCQTTFMTLRCCPCTHITVRNILSIEKTVRLAYIVYCCFAWVCVWGHIIKRKQTRWAGDCSCTVSRFLPRVVHLSRWRHAYESDFSSDLRIPHSVQCREAFCPHTQTLRAVCRFARTDSKVREAWLLPASLWGLASTMNRCFLPWWMKTGVSCPSCHLLTWVDLIDLMSQLLWNL